MISYEQGKICVLLNACEQASYDMGSEKNAVVADGNGGLLSYKVNDRPENFVLPFLSATLTVGGKPLDPSSQKKVTMGGRMQKVEYAFGAQKVTATVFTEKETSGVFFSFTTEGAPFTLALDLRAVKTMASKRGDYFEEGEFCLSFSEQVDWMQENESFYVTAKRVNVLLSVGEAPAEHKKAFAAFEQKRALTEEEVSSVVFPAAVKTEEEKAFYLQSYFAALQNFKVAGAFKAFAAGSEYTYPLRTYFRDSYFTVLCMLGTHPELVREELLTLAKCIDNGACPSAVKSDFTAFWGNHYDSPSLFIIQLYDYVRTTGDESILSEPCGDGVLLDQVQNILKKLSEYCDDSGLIYKEGLNRRDWADEVNRGGYVTYVEALYARALYAAAALYEGHDATLSALYLKKFTLVKKAINDLLFDPKKGYYVNFKSREFTEDNLSIDTVFTLLFDLAEGERAALVLNNMERILESANNKTQPGGDFGAMCVYPLYQRVGEAVHKSARPFDYHNGANWPFLTAMYAYAKAKFGREWRDVLLAPFRYCLPRGIYTAVEYFSPYCKAGSRLQAWSSAVAFTYQNAQECKFFNK